MDGQKPSTSKGASAPSSTVANTPSRPDTPRSVSNEKERQKKKRAVYYEFRQKNKNEIIDWEVKRWCSQAAMLFLTHVAGSIRLYLRDRPTANDLIDIVYEIQLDPKFRWGTNGNKRLRDTVIIYTADQLYEKLVEKYGGISGDYTLTDIKVVTSVTQ